ncbi:ATP-binding cassette domain-containing protein [bacterium]|nr:ATP-binding cassette domain-containing protein [bacterium]
MILSVDGVSFAYPSNEVLHDVRCEVAAGELMAILGPNGAGKTTLLKCIDAILRPQGGAVRVEGRDVLRLSAGEIARQVGYVAQRTEVALSTVYDAVLLGRRPHIRWDAGEDDLRMVDAALRRLDLQPLALRPLDQLSGGELQKVAVARALVQEPRLLLLDEPTSWLDLRNQVAILDLIRRVVDEHEIAAVMTMHDLNTALSYADTVLLLKEGRVHAHGPGRAVDAATIEAVYGLPVVIHRVDGRPVVVPREGPSRGRPHRH